MYVIEMQFDSNTKHIILCAKSNDSESNFRTIELYVKVFTIHRVP